jgi:putative nucleotidyltransferase with HDIG domain
MKSSDKIKIDLTYLGPNNIIVYPLYTKEGEKIVEAREVLTSEKINSIIQKYGKVLYYSFTDQLGVIPPHKLNSAFNFSKEIMAEVHDSDRINLATYKKSEKLIDDIMNDLYLSDINSIRLLKSFKSFDEYTFTHSVNVLVLSAVFATKLGIFSKSELRSMAIGAFLHDIGKMKIDKQLLNKKEKLAVDEFQKMKRHPQLGYEIVKNLLSENTIVQQVVLFHHEKYNNEGYYGLPYDSLPVFSKIVSICDVFDALTTTRPYRSSITPAKAINLILNLADKQFDYNLINSFINRMGPVVNSSWYFYAKHQICELNTGELALILDYTKDDILGPKVAVFCKLNKGAPRVTIKYYDKPVFIDLSTSDERRMINLLPNNAQTYTMKDVLLERALYKLM